MQEIWSIIYFSFFPEKIMLCYSHINKETCWLIVKIQKTPIWNILHIRTLYMRNSGPWKLYKEAKLLCLVNHSILLLSFLLNPSISLPSHCSPSSPKCVNLIISAKSFIQGLLRVTSVSLYYPMANTRSKWHWPL